MLKKKMSTLVVMTALVSACTTYDPYTGEEEVSKATTGAIAGAVAGALIGVATLAAFTIFAFRTGTFMPERAIRATSSLVFSNSFDLVHSFDLSMMVNV